MWLEMAMSCISVLMSKYFVLYKPFDVLSQFSREVPTHRTLADCYDFPPAVYPVGRLDRDSEGLLILTDDKSLNHRLLNPVHQHSRSYFVQVEGLPSTEALQRLQEGVSIRINKKNYQTQAAKVTLLDAPPLLPDRNPPIRFRQHIPTTWLNLVLQEGKNRQVRRMCAAVGYPVLRLVRHRIEELSIEGMDSGEVKSYSHSELYEALRLR